MAFTTITPELAQEIPSLSKRVGETISAEDLATAREGAAKKAGKNGSEGGNTSTPTPGGKNGGKTGGNTASRTRKAGK